jgi:IS5 family transposase
MGKEIGEVYGNLVAQKEKVPDTIDTVWKAAAYGDTDVLKELLEADAAAANVADPSGYRPLHVRRVHPVCRASLRSATRPCGGRLRSGDQW